MKDENTSASTSLSWKQARFSCNFRTHRSVKLTWEMQWARSRHCRSVLVREREMHCGGRMSEGLMQHISLYTQVCNGASITGSLHMAATSAANSLYFLRPPCWVSPKFSLKAEEGLVILLLLKRFEQQESIWSGLMSGSVIWVFPGPRSHGGRQVFLPPCDLGMRPQVTWGKASVPSPM